VCQTDAVRVGSGAFFSRWVAFVAAADMSPAPFLAAKVVNDLRGFSSCSVQCSSLNGRSDTSATDNDPFRRHIRRGSI